MPDSTPNLDFSVVRYKSENPDVVELIDPTHQTKMLEEKSIVWSVVHPEPTYTYSSRWDQH